MHHFSTFSEAIAFRPPLVLFQLFVTTIFYICLFAVLKYRPFPLIARHTQLEINFHL